MFKIGDEVFILDQSTGRPTTGRFAGVARVIKIMPVNVRVDLNGVKITANPALLVPVADFPDHARSNASRVTSEPLPAFGAGDVAKIVRVTVPPNANIRSWTYDPSVLFVVLGVRDRVKVARLGGIDGTRYWNLPAAWLTVVPLTELGL